MEHINAINEKLVLSTLMGKECLDCGGSRAVYMCDANACYTLGLDPNKKYVIKLALGLGGLAQMREEVSFFQEYQDYPLAKILAAGRYIEVMEYVSVDDWIDFAGDVQDLDAYLEDNEISEEDAPTYRKVFEVVGLLETVLGCTGDNGQLGWTDDGRLVAYDYGFIAGKGCRTQTSDISEYAYDEDLMKEYMQGLCDLLNSETELLGDFEHKFLRDSCDDPYHQDKDEEEGEEDDEEENE